MFSSHILRGYFSSYGVPETTRSVRKTHLLIGCKQKLNSNPTMSSSPRKDEYSRLPDQIYWHHLTEIYSLGSGSFCHSCVTEAKCLKKSEQSSAVTAYRAQCTCTQKAWYINTRPGQKLKAYLSFCHRVSGHNSRTLENTWFRLNSLKKMLRKRV